MNEKMSEENFCIVTEMRNQKLEFFLNSANEPTVYIPDDPFQQDWPADSQRITDLMQVLHHEFTGQPPTRPKLEFSKVILREECRMGGRRLSQSEAAERDKEPIVQALHEYTSTSGEFDGKTAELLTRLRDLHAIRSEYNGDGITPFVHVFGRTLRRLAPTLRGYGIDISLHHQEDGSYCKTKQLKNFELEATDGTKTLPSACNQKSGKDLPATDGTDGKIAIDAPSLPPELFAASKKQKKGGDV